jgi:hypothetical protein
MKRVARTLKTKAISSFKRGTAAFNGVEDDGRQTAILLHLQHSFEMLLKAALRERNVDVFERGTDSTVGRSIGYEKCVRLARQHVALNAAQCGTLRAIDAMRDDEQHWIADFSEGLLYLHARAGVTLFDEILHSVFSERLADHLPDRVLPISTSPPTDIEALIDEQFSQVQELLRPGNRKRVEARAILRGLLALESHVSDDVAVNERDVNRVMKGVLDGGTLEQVFPRLSNVGTAIAGAGPSLTVHFTKREGAPVHFIPADDPREAAAVREVDLQRKYYIAPRELAGRAGLTVPKSAALRRELGIDEDEQCVHEFVFGSQRINRYSDNALRRVMEGVETLDMEDVWERNKPSRPG